MNRRAHSILGGLILAHGALAAACSTDPWNLGKPTPASCHPGLEPSWIDAQIGDDATSPEGSVSAPDAASGTATEADAACQVAIGSPPLLLPASHVPIGCDIRGNSNPPSSGPHYPIWAAYRAYTTPVPRGYYVHDLEHGAVVFLYNCPAGCPDTVAALNDAARSLPDDPVCAAAGMGVRVRVVITPDPLLDVPVAAVAWGWTYKASCVDLPSLKAFAAAHYGNGPETLCANGTTAF